MTGLLYAYGPWGNMANNNTLLRWSSIDLMDIFRVKFKSVKLTGGRSLLAARSDLNVRTYDLRAAFMPAQIIQTMAFIQIMNIWRPGRSLEDHLNMRIIHVAL